MRYLKLVGPYEHYGNPNMWDKDSPIQCVVDACIYANEETDPNKQVMLLVEPRSIQPNVYDYVLKVADRYKYIFTHDSQLLNNLPNTKPLFWSTVWCRSEEVGRLDNIPKTKLISMVSSNKEMCPLHVERKRIARLYKDAIDVFGTIDGGNFVDPIDTLKDYKYSVVIENYKDNLWFTEKILNCFATYTIPIYYGARDIDMYFDAFGIIRCSTIDELQHVIEMLITDVDFANSNYIMKQDHLKRNYELSKKYDNFERRFYEMYKDEIEGMFK